MFVQYTSTMNVTVAGATACNSLPDRNVRRILVRGVNAPVPPEAKKIKKI